MKTLDSIQLALLVVGASFTSTTFAGKPGSNPPPPPSSGVVVLSYPDANSWALAAAPSGLIYAVGDSDLGKELVLASTDSGSSWSLVDDYSPAGQYIEEGIPFGGDIALDSTGVLYVTGRSHDNEFVQPDHWYVRRSINGGASWVTVDDYVMRSATIGADAVSVAVDGTGDVYVSGYDFYSTGTGPINYDWIIRKGIGGTSFSVVDFLPNSLPIRVFVHPTAGVFVVGQTRFTVRSSITWAWLVRRSSDGGATWSNVDTIPFSSSSFYSAASGISADRAGNLYVVGQGREKTTSAYRWLVRKSTDGGNSWTTVDSYQLAAGQHSCARCVATDAAGNVFVAGQGNLSDGTSVTGCWVLRKSVGGTEAWKTVDVFPNGGLGATANAIAADPFGNVFVGGYGGPNDWLIKRY
jgi:hypothetical protein